MTKSLEKAFAKASNLPEEAQEQLAEQMSEDIEGELRWDQILADSQDQLENMAQKARRAQQNGKIVRKEFGLETTYIPTADPEVVDGYRAQNGSKVAACGKNA